MGTVKRYDMDLEPHSGGQMNEWPEGEYVLHTDYAALEAERDEWHSQLAMRNGTLDMAVARLGGTVEDRPTVRHNFLQRIDELVAKEAALTAAEQRAKELQEALQETLEDLDQTLRQWVMYADMQDERDLRSDSSAEGQIYRNIAIRRGKNDSVLDAALAQPRTGSQE